MTIMIYDTLKMATRLEGSFSREQAAALTDAIATSTSDTVATRSDIVMLEAKITDSKDELIKWIVSAIVLNLFGTAGLVPALTRMLSHP